MIIFKSQMIIQTEHKFFNLLQSNKTMGDKLRLYDGVPVNPVLMYQSILQQLIYSLWPSN